MTARARTRTVPGLVLPAHGELPRLEEVRVEPPGPGEVRIRIAASGVCHTDLAAVRDARVCPVLLGHEGAGIVESVGAGVEHVAAGAHVVVNWQPRCGTCRACVTGRSAFCDGVRATATPRVHRGGDPLAVLLHAGTFCPFAVVPARGAVPVRADLDLRLAALLGCAVATGVGAALYSADVRAGDVVVVVGCGGVGLNVIQGARMREATVIAVDIDRNRLALAAAFGAAACVDPARDNTAAIVAALSDGRGADHVIEVVGRTETMTEGIDLLARGGTLTLVGAAARDARLSVLPRSFMSRQLRLQGCIYGDVHPERDLPLFADWYADGRLQLDPLHTRTISLDDLPGEFHGAPAGGVRTVVDMAGYG